MAVSSSLFILFANLHLGLRSKPTLNLVNIFYDFGVESDQYGNQNSTLSMISKPVMQQWQNVNSSQSFNHNHMDLFIALHASHNIFCSKNCTVRVKIV